MRGRVEKIGFGESKDQRVRFGFLTPSPYLLIILLLGPICWPISFVLFRALILAKPENYCCLVLCELKLNVYEYVS